MDRVALTVTVFFVSVAAILFSGYWPAQIAAGVVVLGSARALYLMVLQRGELGYMQRMEQAQARLLSLRATLTVRSSPHQTATSAPASPDLQATDQSPEVLHVAAAPARQE